MADNRKQLFKAEINVGVLAGNAVKQLQNLSKLVNKTTSSIDNDFKKLPPKLTLLDTDLVQKQLYDLESVLSRLPDKTSASFKRLSSDFSSIRGDVANVAKPVESLLLQINAEENKQLSLSEGLKKVVAEFGATSSGAIQLQQSLNDSNERLSSLNSELSKYDSQFREVADDLTTVSKRAGDATANIVSETNEVFTRLNKNAGVQTQTFGQTLLGLGKAAVIAFGDSETKAFDARKAIFGLGDSTNFLAKRLDQMSGNLFDGAAGMTALQRETLTSVQSMVKLTSASTALTSNIKELAKTEGVSPKVFTKLENQFTTLNNAQQNLQAGLETTGKVSEGAFNRVRIEAEKTISDIAELRAVLGKDIPPDLAESLNKIEANAKLAVNQTKDLNVQRVKLDKETEVAAQKETQLGNALEENRSILQRFLGIFKRTTEETQDAVTANKELEQSFTELEDQVQSTSKFVEGFKNSLSGIGGLALGGLAIGGIFTAIDLSVAEDLSKAQLKIAAATGTATEASEKFRDVVKDVYANNFGNSIEDVGEVVQEVTLRLQRLGITGTEALSEASQSAFRLRDTFGADTTDTIDAVAVLMQEFGLSSEEAFDFVTSGFQKGLNASGDFLDTIREYSTQFSAGNASADEFFNIIDSGLQGGTLGTDKAADAFKEFRVRIQDGSVLTSKSLQQLGFDVKAFQDQLASGEITASQAFGIILDKLRETEDENIKFQAGVGLLGTQYEDLASSVDLLSTSGASLADLEGATASLDVQYNSLSGALQAIRRNFLLAFDTGKVGSFVAKFVPLAASIAESLSNLFGNLVGFFDNIVEAVTSRIDLVLQGTGTITGFIDNMIAVVYSLIQGDWSTAWQFAGIALNEGLVAAVDIINSFISQAPTWGASLVNEITNGIYSAAGPLIEAANYIASLIALPLQAFSPPKEGPLSDIDEWGGNLMQTFTDGIPDVDITGFLTGEEGLTELRNKNLALLKKISEGEEQLRRDDQNILNIKRQIIEAEKKGFIPAELKKKLSIAEKERALNEDQLDLNKDQSKATEDRISELEKQAEESKNLYDNIVKGSKSSLSSVGKLAKAENKLNNNRAKGGKAAAAASKAATKGVEKEIETIEQKYARDRQLAEQRYKSGITNEKQYYEELLKAEENYVNASVKQGKPIFEDTVGRIEDYKAKIEELKKDDGKGGGGILGGIIPSPKIVEEKAAEVEEALENAVESVKANLTDRLRQPLGNLKLPFGLAKLGETLKNFFEDNPGIKVGLKVLSGVLASIATGKIITKLLKLAATFTKFGLSISKLTVAGLAINAIFYNWDTIWPILKAGWDILSDGVNTFTEALGGVEPALDTISGLIDEAGSVASQVGQALFDGVLEGFKTGDFTSGLKTAFQGITGIDLSGLLGGLNLVGDAAGGGFTTIFNSLKESLTSFLDPELIARLESFKESFNAFFTEEGRLGTELILLFNTIKDTLSNTVLPVIQAIVASLSGGAGGAGLGLAAVIGIIVGIIPGFISALGAIEKVLAGVVRVVTGVVNILGGLFNIISGGLDLIIAVLSGGDIEGAAIRVQQASAQIVQGVLQIFEGLFSVVSQTLNGVVQFIGGWIVNVATLFGFGGEEWVQRLSAGLTNFDFFIDSINAIFRLVTGTITDWFYSLSSVTSFIADWVGGILDWFYSLYDEAVGNSIIPDLVNGIINSILGLGPAIIQNFLPGFVTDFLGGFGDLAKGVTENILPGFLESVGGLFGGFTDSSAESTTAFNEESQAGFSDTFSSISSIFATNTTDIAKVWDTFTNFLYASSDEALTRVEDNTKSRLNSTTNAFAQAGNAQAEIVSDSSDFLIKYTEKTSKEFIKVVEETIKEFKKTIEEIPDLIKEVMEESRDMFEESGKSMIDGLIVGVKENTPKLLELFKEIARAAVDSVNNQLGIQSPSKVFEGIGLNIVQGFVEGIDQGNFEDAIKPFKDFINDVNSVLLNQIKRRLRDDLVGVLDKDRVGLSKDIAIRLKKDMVGILLDLDKAGGEAISDAEFSNIIYKRIAGLPYAEKSAEIITRAFKNNFVQYLDEAGDLINESIENIEKLFTEAQLERINLGQSLVDFSLTSSEQATAEFDKQIAGLKELQELFNKETGNLTPEFLAGLSQEQQDLVKEATGFFLKEGELFFRQFTNASKTAFIDVPASSFLENGPKILGNTLQINKQLAETEKKRAELQEKLLRIQEKQAKLATLQNQLDLLNQIQEAGLDPKDVLGGLQLGLDASIDDILEATERAVDAIINQVNEQLQISSPSKVMKKLGEFTFEGFAEGIIGKIPTLPDLTAPLTNSLVPAFTGSNNSSRAVNISFGDVILNNGDDARTFERRVTSAVERGLRR